jgi:D-xylose 1-dehydrogenase (NADP+, D-xylono-1,5-lactone-forming)
LKKQTVNWGVLGAAKIARSLATALRDSKLACSYAVASRSLPKAKAFAREYGFQKCYERYQTLLNDPEVDVIYNPLPNHLHCAWTIRALEAGKHVLCEKPLAKNAAECRRMIAAAKRNNRLLMEAFMYRVHPQTLRIQELLRERTIGEIRVMRAGFGFTLDEDSGNVRLETRMGGGCLMDVGCYCVNAIRTFFGEEPSLVLGHAERGKRTKVDMNFAGTLVFSEGKLGIFNSSFRTVLDRGIEIIGTRGRILAPSPWKPDGKLSTFTLEVDGKAKVIEIRDGGEIYHNEVNHFSRCVLTNKPPLIPPEDGWRNMIVIDALKRSARTGRRVKITGRIQDNR